MSEQLIEFQYKEGVVRGGYSFSANNNVIILSGFVKNLKNKKIREAIQYEAKTARTLYVDKVNEVRNSGEQMNQGLIKQNASAKARNMAKDKYAEVWSEVEDICSKFTP